MTASIDDVNPLPTAALQPDLTEARLQSLFNDTPDIHIFLDPTGCVIDANTTLHDMARVLGTSEVKPGVRFETLVDAAYVESYRQHLAQALAGRRVTVEIALPNPQLPLFYFEFRYLPLLQNGKIVGVHLAGEDITRLRQAEQALWRSEELYCTLAANLPDGAVVVFDQDLRAVVASGLEMAESGLFHRDIKGKRLQEIFPVEISTLFEPNIRAALDGRLVKFEITLDDLVYEIHALPLGSLGGAPSAMVMTQNITEQRQAQRALADFAVELERRVEERTAQLNQITAQLEDLNASLEERVRQRTFELTMLSELSQKIGYTLNYDDLIRSLLDNLHRAVAYDVAAGLIITDHFNELMIQPVVPIVPEVTAFIRSRIEDALRAVGSDFDTGALTVTMRHPNIVNSMRQIDRLQSFLEVPIMVGDALELVGILFVGIEEPDAFTADDIRLLYTAASQSAGSIHRLRTLLATEQERLENLVDSLPEGVLLLDANREIMLANPTAREYLAALACGGYAEPVTALGRLTLDELLTTAGDRCWHEISVDGSEGEQPRVFEAKAQVFAVPDQTPGWQIVIRDVTDRKKAEQELHKALLRERELNELKSRFIMTTSHEFRTPLSVILSSAESLNRYRHRLNEQQRASRLQKIETQVKHMTQLLDDMLLLGRLDMKGIAFKPGALDLLELTNGIVEEFRQAVPRFSFDFRWEGRLNVIEADDKLLREIITNLLSNAVKYSGDSTRIEILLRYDAETVTLSVTDYGIGIPESDRRWILTPFHRGKNVGLIQGTGLGLSITQRAVELHQGEIIIESQLGQGSTFHVRLPFQRDTVPSSPMT